MLLRSGYPCLHCTVRDVTVSIMHCAFTILQIESRSPQVGFKISLEAAFHVSHKVILKGWPLCGSDCVSMLQNCEARGELDH